jgi:hypothetical protein
VFDETERWKSSGGFERERRRLCLSKDVLTSTITSFCCHRSTVCICHYQLFQVNGCNRDIDLSNSMQTPKGLKAHDVSVLTERKEGTIPLYMKSIH